VVDRLGQTADGRTITVRRRSTEEHVMADDLFEISEEMTMTREDAAAVLHDLADQLARHNQIEFAREGIRYTVRVPDQVSVKVEVEIGEESEIEFELSW
jgi:amphi-Trp domain-containing protein